ncbi:MAG: DsbA family oxidoreductase [Bauldia sp.]|nr:DsbA family oxidoreductase [Bauldia sp.]
MADQPITIDVWSDVACPWCYIGKRRLELALAEFAKTPGAPRVALTFHSFELNPGFPVDFEGSQTDYFERLRGIPAAQFAQMQERVIGLAAALGLDYDMDAVRMTNTVKAHELVHFARAHGKQAEMKERLMRAYFMEGRHLGRVAELAALAAEIGLDPSAAARSLETDEYLSAVRADQELAMRYGIQGVPFYVLDNKYGISGAQDPALFLKALQTVAKERTTS